ncbi:hypothetical protein ATO6_24295, partial [Oceanicola sp. 22II-s10i]
MRIDVQKEDIARYLKQGDNLIIELANGDRITVTDFYVPTQNGSLHSLLLADSGEAGEQGLFAANGGLGMGMEEQAALAAAGLGGLGLALGAANDDDDDASTDPTDTTDNTDNTDVTDTTDNTDN